MNPIVWLIVTVIDLVMIALFVWIVLSLLVAFNIVNRWHPLVGRVYDALSQLFEPMLRPIRRVLPPVAGFDLSPVVLIIGLQFIEYTIFYFLT